MISFAMRLIQQIILSTTHFCTIVIKMSEILFTHKLMLQISEICLITPGNSLCAGLLTEAGLIYVVHRVSNISCIIIIYVLHQGTVFVLGFSLKPASCLVVTSGPFPGELDAQQYDNLLFSSIRKRGNQLSSELSNSTSCSLSPFGREKKQVVFRTMEHNLVLSSSARKRKQKWLSSERRKTTSCCLPPFRRKPPPNRQRVCLPPFRRGFLPNGAMQKQLYLRKATSVHAIHKILKFCLMNNSLPHARSIYSLLSQLVT